MSYTYILVHYVHYVNMCVFSWMCRGSPICPPDFISRLFNSIRIRLMLKIFGGSAFGGNQTSIFFVGDRGIEPRASRSRTERSASELISGIFLF